MAQLGPQEMSELSPKIDLKRTLLGPHSPITIFDARHNSADQRYACHAPYRVGVVILLPCHTRGQCSDLMLPLTG
jgi:hypothetical protein